MTASAGKVRLAKRPRAIGTARAPESVTLKSIAQSAGLDVAQLLEVFRREAIEPTFTIEETAAALRCGVWQVNQLVRLGIKFGEDLHPTRGGLFPTYKLGHRSREIPLSAIARHRRHMARVHDHVVLDRVA